MLEQRQRFTCPPARWPATLSPRSLRGDLPVRLPHPAQGQRRALGLYQALAEPARPWGRPGSATPGPGAKEPRHYSK